MKKAEIYFEGVLVKEIFYDLWKFDREINSFIFEAYKNKDKDFTDVTSIVPLNYCIIL